MASNGEKHVADVRTPSGVVFEFQHSAIADTERAARSDFYGNIIWVVDGLRRQRDRPRFEREIEDWRRWERGARALGGLDWALPKEWLGCSVPVVFDFGPNDGYEVGETVTDHTLWCLLPKHSASARLLIAVPAREFIDAAQLGHPLPEWRTLAAEYEAQQAASRLADARRMQEDAKRAAYTRWARGNGLHRQ